MPEIHVREMTKSEFGEWREGVIRAYADAQAAAGTWPAEDALDRARTDNDALLPGGVDTPGMIFLRACRPDGTGVGVLWLGMTHPRGKPGCAFVYDFAVDAAHRGSGYGRALLAAAEDAARTRGATALELNVFGDNLAAIRLYETSGYQVVTQQMRKPLS